MSDSRHWDNYEIQREDATWTTVSKEKQQSELEKLDELKSWIERNQLGKGLDGSDRWEHCASEIIQKIEALKETKEPVPPTIHRPKYVSENQKSDTTNESGGK